MEFFSVKTHTNQEEEDKAEEEDKHVEVEEAEVEEGGRKGAKDDGTLLESISGENFSSIRTIILLTLLLTALSKISAHAFLVQLIIVA